MQQDSLALQGSRAGWGWPLVTAFMRLPLILLGNGAAVLALRLAGSPVGIATGAVWSTMSVTLANVVCLGLLEWRARAEGFRLRDALGLRRGRLLRDVAEGALWSLVLFALALAGFLAAASAVQRIAGLTFAQLYLGEAELSFALPQWLTVLMVAISGIVFPIVNAPVEELQYRGYAQPRLIAASKRTWLGTCIPALGFALQHVAFAFTVAAAPVYVAGFFLWGLGAGLIYNRRRRLAPLVVAHFISNLSFGIVPLFFLLQGV